MGELLFQPLTLPNGTLLKNRFFKSAMSETLGDRHQLPSRELIKLYDQWANEDIGVLVTGNVMIDSRYLGEPGNVALDSDKNLELFKDWAQAGKKRGRLFGCNLIILVNKCIALLKKNRLHLVLSLFQENQHWLSLCREK